METRILLVDDHQMLCQGIRIFLEREVGFKMVGESRDGRAAIELAKLHRPHVVIMNKLNIHNVAELTKYAIREGLTTAEP